MEGESFLLNVVGSCGGVGIEEFALILLGGGVFFSSWRGGISEQYRNIFLLDTASNVFLISKKRL